MKRILFSGLLTFSFCSFACTSNDVGPEPVSSIESNVTQAKRVGVYTGSGAGDEYVNGVFRSLADDARFDVRPFGNGTSDFSRFDVVVFPGGLASQEWEGLGWAGREALRAFVKDGGGFIGICAGFYLGLVETAGLIPASYFEPWARGTGWVEIDVKADSPIFHKPGKRWLRYENGPLPKPTGDGLWPQATFTSAVDDGAMIGDWAVTANWYGQGRVVAFSPHPELSDAADMLADAITWAARD